MKIMPSCREVAETISKEDMATLSGWGRVKYHIHMARCRDCRAYMEQIHTLGSTARDLYRDVQAEFEPMPQLEAAILEKCGEGPDRRYDAASSSSRRPLSS